MRKRKDPEPDAYPYLRLMDLDPGGPKTCGSVSGSESGSPTSVPVLMLIFTVGTFTSIFKDNKSLRSPKPVEIKVFLNFFWLVDPNPYK
jgi:hypothetical protein